MASSAARLHRYGPEACSESNDEILNHPLSSAVATGPPLNGLNPQIVVWDQSRWFPPNHRSCSPVRDGSASLMGQSLVKVSRTASQDRSVAITKKHALHYLKAVSVTLASETPGTGQLLTGDR
jgi:hypothetical protein